MSEAPARADSPESPLETSTVGMPRGFEKPCPCPVCGRTFAWPISMVDHVVEVHGPVLLGATEFSADLVNYDTDKGIFWRHTYDSFTYGVEKRKERLDAHERVDLLYPLLTTKKVVCDGFTTTIIGGGC